LNGSAGTGNWFEKHINSLAAVTPKAVSNTFYHCNFPAVKKYRNDILKGNDVSEEFMAAILAMNNTTIAAISILAGRK